MPRKNANARETVGPAQKRIWRHNGFFGHARMIHSQCEAMIHSDTTTPETKAIAARILSETKELTKSLKERLDPK